MDRRIAFAVLSAIIILGGAPGAMAAKKHAAANASASAQIADPRAAYKEQGHNQQSWCDVNPDCNGWNEWLKDTQEGKLKADTGYTVHY
jgi:hypothetical protein